jgi:hypothetical protein
MCKSVLFIPSEVTVLADVRQREAVEYRDDSISHGDAIALSGLEI